MVKEGGSNMVKEGGCGMVRNGGLYGEGRRPQYVQGGGSGMVKGVTSVLREVDSGIVREGLTVKEG